MGESVELTIDELRHILSEWKKTGKIFGVHFIKRTDGELRTMSCRGGVSCGLSEKPKKQKSSDGLTRNIVTVFDMNKKAYRGISLEGICQLSLGDVVYQVEVVAERC